MICGGDIKMDENNTFDDLTVIAPDVRTPSIPVVKEQRRNHTIAINLTQEELDDIEAAAVLAGGIPKSTYVRAMAVKAARAELQKPLFV